MIATSKHLVSMIYGYGLFMNIMGIIIGFMVGESYGKIQKNNPPNLVNQNDIGGGQKILEIYKHFKAEPGSMLNAGNFVAVGKRRRWNMNDLQSDLEIAVKKNWLEPTDKGHILTNLGFAIMEKLP